MTEKVDERKCLAVVRIRGTISASRENRETLRMLNLTRTNNAVLVDNRPAFIGMLKAARNYITWGEASKEAVYMLIKERGRLAGNEKLTDDYAQKIGHKSLEELAQAVFSCSTEYSKLSNVQPTFNLHPPTKGFKGKTKKGYGTGGELGYRGEKINELIKRMI
ncbi:MAG TPA: 50S ribosomal protein L30 [Candidatus Bathyarchaeia archaeon]